MITKEIEVNGSKFKLTLTDQVIGQVDNLKSLYATAAEDPEIFEQVSSEISDTINQISSTVLLKCQIHILMGSFKRFSKQLRIKNLKLQNQLKNR